MNALDVACPRCGEANRSWARFCWVCGSPIAAEQPLAHPPAAGRARRPPQSAGAIVLKVVLISLALVGLIPVLLLVTCFGLVFLGNMKF